MKFNYIIMKFNYIKFKNNNNNDLKFFLYKIIVK